eukprot:5789888-Ditylum_brightwellii.AAC.1
MALLSHLETEDHDDDWSLIGKMLQFVLNQMLYGDDEDEDHDEYYSLAPKCCNSEAEFTCYDIFCSFTGFLTLMGLLLMATSMPSKVYWFWKKKVGTSVKIVSVQDISNLDSSSSTNGGEGEFTNDEDYKDDENNKDGNNNDVSTE